MTSLTDSPLNDTTPRGTAQAKLAIVGMSCRLPGGATDTEKFWEIMANGLDVSRRIPAYRFDIETHFDADGKQMNKTMTEHGCFIDEPGLFDASFFNMSPREAMAVDPQMRLSLVTAYETLEQAGFVPDRTLSTKSERICTYYGQAADAFLVVAVPSDQAESTTSSYSPAHHTQLDTACSSGLAAIELACQALWNGDVDTADATADGYCRADGVGSVVIKKLEDAQANNDNILGVILGCGTNHSAEAVSITHPHAGHQSYLSRQVLRQAGVNPLDVSYIELHGTGTQAGDYEEMQGILDVYAPDSSSRRRSDQKLHIGSVKSNIGHGESVAGTSALIKVLSMLQHNAIPPHIGIKTEINPRFAKYLNNSKRNIHIPFSEVEWPQTPGKKRIAGINNFGAAGGNTTMILEEAPSRPQREADPRSSHVISVSAKSRKALAGNIERLIAYLDLHGNTVSIADLAYTTTARRHQHQFRIAMSVSDIPQARKQLDAAMNKVDTLPAVAKSSSPPVAFAFTGQGASYQSMDLELYRDVPSFREHIQHLDAMAQAQGFPSFIPAINGSHHKDHTHAPVITQLSLVCVEIALAEYWASPGVTPDIVIGHSLGEYAAACCAGIVSTNDAIFPVGRRAEMLSQRCVNGSHCMMAVRASLAAIGEAAGSRAYTVACVNGPSDVVLSGKTDEVDELAVILEAAGFRCIKLNVAFAFHSEQTDPVLDYFEAACAGVVFNEPKLPIISPLLGKVVFDSRTFNANYVRRATRETVDFVSALENAYSVSSIAKETVWIEIGPHPVCANFLKSTLPSTQLTLPSLRRGEDNWKTISQSIVALHLTGIYISFHDFHAPFASQVRLLDLPSYAWDEKRYWLQYNGNWCLTKDNTYYDDKDNKIQACSAPPVYESLSSLVRNIIEVHVDGTAGTVVMQSDLMQKDFYASAQGHRMNDCGVVTSSIHADIAYTMGDYLYRKFYPKAGHVDIDMGNLVVTSGLIAHKGPTSVPQITQVTAHTDNIETGSLDLMWQSVALDGSVLEPFATANITYGDASVWRSLWSPMSHLVLHRIEMLDTLASQGQANRLTRNMAYTLFANNLVDYAEKYRGMQSVVIHDLEAYAEVYLSTKEDGAKFMVPPYFIDSVAHLAGYIMNCSDSMDTQKYYCVTSSWNSMKFAEPLVAGGRYRSYVKMIPTKDDPSVFLGDVYILSAEHNNIIGFVGGIHFRRFPRILLGRFFPAPEVPKAAQGQAKIQAPPKAAKISSTPAAVSEPQRASAQGTATTKPAVVTPNPAVHIAAEPIRIEDDHSSSSTISSSEGIMTPPSGAVTVADRALMLIAQETALDVADLEDSAEFVNLGIDSLMSLVLTEKLRGELDVKVNGSLFLDYPTIGDLRSWLVEYYN
ncbi:Type I Iterative PKS [Elasticomyces elasticus]|nr:Type I Iterative PKS [Elasticomyces elasticus]